MKKTEQILMKIDGELKNDFQQICEYNSTSMSKVLNTFIKSYVEENGSKMRREKIQLLLEKRKLREEITRLQQQLDNYGK